MRNAFQSLLAYLRKEEKERLRFFACGLREKFDNDDILSNAFTFSTAPIVRPSLVLIKFKHPKNYSLYSNLSSLFALNIITTLRKGVRNDIT